MFFITLELDLDFRIKFKVAIFNNRFDSLGERLRNDIFYVEWVVNQSVNNVSMLSVERLGDSYVKVEDVNQRYRPMYKSLTSLPVIHFNRPFGICIFAPSSDHEQEHDQTTRDYKRPQSKAKQQPHRCTCSCCTTQVHM